MTEKNKPPPPKKNNDRFLLPSPPIKHKYFESQQMCIDLTVCAKYFLQY